jgi:hypothetical protein
VDVEAIIVDAHIMHDPALLKTRSDMIPVKRPGTAKETAAVLLFLASDKASCVVGAIEQPVRTRNPLVLKLYSAILRVKAGLLDSESKC